MTEPITYLGPPGTGKTQNLSNLIRNCLEDNISPERIACVSFTRKAAQESRERVCKDWGLEEDSLPHFQTLHAMAFRSGGYKVDNVMRLRTPIIRILKVILIYWGFPRGICI